MSTQWCMPASVGFVGLGAMGWHMARNLRQKLPSSSTLYINDVVKSVSERFAAEYGSLGPVVISQNAAEVAKHSDVILSIVPEGKHVAAVYATTEGGALSDPAVLKGKLVLECSTIDVATSREVAAAVEAAGAVFVDAPVSGGSAGADKGTLTFMMGLNAGHARLAEIRTLLELMGKNIFECGGPTLGLCTKICNNYVGGTIAIATSEGFNLAMRLGVDPVTFRDVLAVSTGGSWVNQSCNPVPGVQAEAPASDDYAPGFKVQFMRKDYNLAVEAAKLVDAKMYLAESGLDVYTRASADPNCVDRDSRVVYRFIGGDENWKKDGK
ncbi:hypothetical protein CC85DRAFT_288450 [Cutaneotrichosporon oleaginosum]|uniref:3-hydroxyisobutyrate dehydrogenase n=1 Tax=Cutaneotrichosporon oleaginosum TaxID=879819 RepID=A0A0J0XEQ8_9TREE|nr:uncharacterized protein CC85DRAFT_288450 [Cutaneotrichosporon oleaginosum]KLT39533.1 hypothetical protein CC85DRAFT_288450 [Cutaneotrichosporon oleaginosum]TXT07068.1 hypothetical protein COLE_06399 [Cutaneotrichosporon oleaginosum]